MAHPKVSVLIPTYNYARYLPEAIESVLKQDFQDFELLIGDDQSPDGSEEILKHYAARDPRIRFEVHPSRLGMVPNWNWCLAQARGEYIKFLFGDDKLASRGALRGLLELLEANPSASLAVSARYVINERSEIVEVWDDLGVAGLHRGQEIIVRCLRESRNLIGEPSVVLFRRRDAERGFNVAYRQIVDQEMWFHLLERGDLVYTHAPLCCFRRHGRQQTEVNKVNQIGEREALRLFAEYHDRPYMRTRGSREHIFNQIYDLRKRCRREPNAPPEVVEVERFLSSKVEASAYRRYWLRRRLCRPLENLTRWFERRLAPASGADAISEPMPDQPQAGDSIAGHTPGAVGAPLPSSRKKVLFLSHDASRTGAPLLLLQCLRWLKQNTDLEFDILLRVRGPLENEFHEIASTWVAERTPITPEFFADVVLIYANTCSNGALLQAWPCKDIPVITHFHELQPSIDALVNDKLGSVKLHTQRFIACSDAVARDLREVYQVPAEKISRVYGGIPVETVLAQARERPPQQVRAELGLTPDTFVIAACGSAAWHKGPDLFLQVARHFKMLSSGRPFCFLWVGWVPNEVLGKALPREAAIFGLQDCIRFVGEQENPQPFLNACDVFCLPSRVDSFPLTMLEAAVLGKPVVCFERSGGAMEFCALGGGYAVPYLDVKAMAERCFELKENPKLRAEVGERAARLVRERFDIQATAAGIWEVIQPFAAAARREPRGRL